MNGEDVVLDCGCVRNPSLEGRHIGSLKTMCDRHMQESSTIGSDELSKSVKVLKFDLESSLANFCRIKS